MARLSYMQRRKGSGIYEFRKRLPAELAGLPAPEHLRAAFPELVNPTTGCFKRELVRSLNTSDPKAAKRENFRHSHEVQTLLEAAVAAPAKGPEVPQPDPEPAPLLVLDIIERETLVELLAQDAEEREHGDDRRRLQTREERAQWPDLVSSRGHGEWRRSTLTLTGFTLKRRPGSTGRHWHGTTLAASSIRRRAR